MAAITTNMASKMATANKSKMNTVNNQNGHQYGRYLENTMASKWPPKNGDFTYYRPLLQFWAEFLGIEQTWRCEWVQQIVQKCISDSYELEKNHPESLI